MVDSCAIPVTGTGSIVGFAHGGHHGDYRRDDCCGISDKDQGYAAVIDAGERTRDVLHGQRFSDNVNGSGHSATQIAVEKIGAASVLATEKNTAELRVQAERIRADQAAQAERINLAQTMALSDMRLEQQKQACAIEKSIADCCCKLEARMLEIDAHRVRDDLHQARAELLALAKGNK